MKTEREIKVMINSLEKRLSQIKNENDNSTIRNQLEDRIKALNWVIGKK